MCNSIESFKRRATCLVTAVVLIALAPGCGASAQEQVGAEKPVGDKKPATSPVRRVVVPKGPERSRLDFEVVGQFTTRYPCCQPRVTNIKRAVELLDGQRIAPGGTFSLNAALGKRTIARGFVSAPMISGGVLIDSVGGGISQVATTLFNAAFFAGLELLEHSPHSFYISRYPMGREATISWGGPELIFRNDWSAPIQIRARATNSSVRFRLLSVPLGRHVVTRTEPAHSYVAPRTIFIQNPNLAPGEQRVRQSAGSPGFDVTYTRRVYAWATLRSRDRFHVRYQPQNAVIEISPPR
jgi:vancomycin resistance protein YoaR